MRFINYSYLTRSSNSQVGTGRNVMEKQLKKLTDQLREDPEYSCSWALKDVNRPKNRYKDIVPYDKSRVILPKYDGVPGSDYINASYIKGSSGAFAYIAAQGPLPNTVIDFWRMIWVCDVQVIVMACNEKEAGKTKCETYWPSKGEIKHYGNISVELIDTSQVCPDFMVRTLLVKCDSEMRDVYQFHYTSWPDHGVPEAVHPMLELVRLMRDCQASETVPIVVHCSAGCGRTGTICAVDYVWACLRHGKLSEDFSLFQIALELRRQRIAMIQTKEQYMLAHKAVATLFEQQLNVIDCHIYVNLDEDGEPLMWKELSKNKFARIKKENSCTKDLPSSNNDATKDKVEQRLNSQSEASVTKLVEKESSEKASSISNVVSTSNNKLHDNMSASEPSIDVNNKNSGSTFSQNSCLSQHSSEDTIPFIDDDEISVRPNNGRAYLNMPSSGSFSKIINRFDPFADQIVLETDDSSPDGDPGSFPQKIAGIQSTENGDQSSVSSSKQDISSENSDQVFPSNYATLPCGSSLNKNYGKTGTRESYPPSRSRYDDSVSDIIEEGDNNSKGPKKVGKATVVRRPSISKLKALFEKSGISSNKSSGEGGKRSLFRHNSHNVSRAGSAPPSLNCMDKTSAVEKESILMLVTRKFRSSSVRTEREVSSKSYDKSQYRKSTPGSIMNLREGFATLSRTVSFNLSKTLRSYSPSKTREKSSVSESGSISSAAEGTSSGNNKSKLPEIQPKGKSTWYDKSSLPRAVAVVKPTEKLSPTPDASNADVPKSPTAKLYTDKSSFPSVIPKPPKLLPFFNSLSKPNGKDTSTMWYNEVDENLSNVESATKSVPITDTETTKSFSKSHNIKVLPFIHSITPWKKSVSKSPLPSPESPKNFEETVPETASAVSNSKFYTDIEKSNDKLELPIKNLKEEALSCPVPEEIIPLSTVSEENNLIHKETCEESLKTLNEFSEQSKNNPGPVQEKNVAIAKEVVDVPPAIPKKMVIGKQKQLENQIFFNEHEVLPNTDGNVLDGTTVPIKRKDSGIKPAIEGKIESPSLSPKDHYINVTPKTLKNIEQIENTVCNNPRGAIIDLTSRESYCMEEELDNALKQLSESAESKTSVIKSSSKFPGYEVIWPEEIYTTDNHAFDLDSKNKFKFHLLKGANDVASKHCKTGLCYSPPLRRSMNAELGLAKCRSCSNIDWLEPNENVSIVENSKEPNTTPTKKLVNEAVVELNTLLDRLTTRTLTEDPELEPKRKQIIKTAGAENDILQNKWPGSDNLMTHSVTILSKNNILDSSSKEEEIVFHFPPPPPLPPPEEDQPTETFNIVRKNGTIKVAADKEETKETSTEPIYAKDSLSSTTSSVSSSEDSVQMVPQPTPRKSKQSGLRKSASYTNICVPQSKSKGYENVFLEKYQTLSRLQIEPKTDNLNQCSNVQSKGSTKPFISNKPQILKPKPDYVNVRDLHISSSPKLSRKSPKRDLDKECISALKISAEEMRKPSNVYNISKEPFTKFDMSKSCPSSELKVYSALSVETDEKYSTYGKICKISDKQLLPSEKRPQDHRYINLSMDKVSDEAKKKPSPSKKTERAPLPPSTTNFIETKEIHTPKELSKKLPSRKLEKAPLPPPLLQKSFTAGNLAKKNMPNATHYVNFPPYRAHISEEAPALPAVHENIPNDLPANALSANLPKTEVKSHQSPSMGHSLSHSQSDASVFLALKERKMQPVNKGLKVFGENHLLARKVLKHKKELVSVSSSDSDSSYERIFFDKPPEQMAKAISKHVNIEQITNSSPRTYKKEMPVAPPRSKANTYCRNQITKGEEQRW
ncbi:Tyrosine-protein phosphatase non-receptor type 12 [Araneus ventricosus]|uniref:protein-tyrosine-phosphatase n=1 Tax=Araneus ventricosus TaxID=182803 RepID=A0A4Y2N4H9_ARAVE|nr:Tyrosine-protein phosphatase non-receptor type 12 [Araneus ventricosus]